VNIARAIRLGERTKIEKDKPRPLLVELAGNGKRSEMLSSARKLRRNKSWEGNLHLTRPYEAAT